MVDNSVFDPGTGGDTYRSKDRAGVKTEIVGIDLGIGGSETLMNGSMPVNDNSGSLTVDNGGTFAVQDSQKVVDNAGFTDGTTPVQPAGYIFDEVAGTALTENDAAAARIDSKRAQVTVLEDATTRGQRAAVSAGGALKVDGSAVTQPVSGTVTANAGSGTFTVSGTVTANAGTGTLAVDTELPAAAALADAASNPTAPAAGAFGMLWNGATWDRAPGGATNGLTTNLKALNGTTIATNSGNKDAGTQRVVIATDQVALTNALKVDGSAVTQPVSVAAALPVTDNSGSLTVDAPVGTPVFTTVTPSATGGWSKIKYAAQTTTVQTPKGTAATFGGYFVYNPNASVAAYVQVFDVATATTVTLGTTVPDMIFAIPAASAANLEITNGVNMANGIKLACTTTATGSTAPTTGLDMTVFYK